MGSKVAADVSRKRHEQLAAMSPAERIALAERLGAEGIQAFMTTHGVDRATGSLRLVGAHAVAARGYPRFTVDNDPLTTDSRVLDRAAWTTIEREGGAVDVRRGTQTTRSAASFTFFSPTAPTSMSCSAGGSGRPPSSSDQSCCQLLRA